MKTITRFGVLRSQIDTKTFNRFVKLSPKGESPGGFFCALPEEDPRMQEMLQLLNTSGLQPWEDKSRLLDKSIEYSLRFQRIYDDDDFEACSYLELSPPPEAHVKGGGNRPFDPFLMLDEPSQWSIIEIGSPYYYAMIDRARQILESEGINNMVFREVKKRYESVDYDLYDEEDIWWELRSDRILPPLAQSMTLLQLNHEPFQGDFSKGCMRKDGLYMNPELHYFDSDLDGIEPFDLAHTYEMFAGLPNEFDRPLVVSKRFYDVCKKHDIKTGWVPVRIDDES